MADVRVTVLFNGILQILAQITNLIKYSDTWHQLIHLQTIYHTSVLVYRWIKRWFIHKLVIYSSPTAFFFFILFIFSHFIHKLFCMFIWFAVFVCCVCIAISSLSSEGHQATVLCTVTSVSFDMGWFKSVALSDFHVWLKCGWNQELTLRLISSSVLMLLCWRESCTVLLGLSSSSRKLECGIPEGTADCY